MPRNRYLICYDIANDRRRTKVFETLRDHGDHAQYSVFFCELSTRELIQLRGSLSDEINQREDQIMILNLGGAANPLESDLQCLGKPHTPPVRAFVV